MESNFRGECARGHIVSTRAGCWEVVESNLVADVHASKLNTPLVFFAVKQVVVPDRHIEQVTRRDAWWIMIIE